MSKIQAFELFQVNLPFRHPFKHGRASREVSESLFLKCRLDSGTVGFGESLPRPYVTGESCPDAYELLRSNILPPLVGEPFESLQSVMAFLLECDGKPPQGSFGGDVPHSAAWCAVDLALLDAFGHEFGESALPIAGHASAGAPNLRYSAVLSQSGTLGLISKTILVRLLGLKSMKLKVGPEDPVRVVRRARLLAGPGIDIRVDANMSWNRTQAASYMKEMARFGVSMFEQPLPAEDIEGLAWLKQQTGLNLMADESFYDASTLDRLIRQKAVDAVNIRISKLGGLMASIARLSEAQAGGLEIYLGCQVGESSLLSAAQLALASSVEEDHIAQAEGCFGKWLLKEDPASPALQFGYGGRAPSRPSGAGFGISVDEFVIRKYAVRTDVIVNKNKVST